MQSAGTGDVPAVGVPEVGISTAQGELLAAIRCAPETDSDTDSVRRITAAANAIDDDSTIERALEYAIFDDRSEAVRILIRRLYAISRGHPDRMRRARDSIMRVLPYTAEKDESDSFRAVLDAYSELWPRARLSDEALTSAMDRACSWGRLDTLRILLDMGVSVRAQNVVSASCSAHGRPVEVLRLLFRHFSADQNVLDEAVAGTTVSSTIKCETRRFLLDEAGAHVDSKRGQLLRVSAIRGSTSSALDLLRRGADPRLAGCTMRDGVQLCDAAEVAMWFGHPDTAHAIREHAAGRCPTIMGEMS